MQKVRTFVIDGDDFILKQRKGYGDFWMGVHNCQSGSLLVNRAVYRGFRRSEHNVAVVIVKTRLNDVFCSNLTERRAAVRNQHAVAHAYAHVAAVRTY